MSDKNVALFLGFGYTAGFLLPLLVEEEWEFVVAPTRKSTKKYELFQSFFQQLGKLEEVNSWDSFDAAALDLTNITHVLITAPPVKGKDPAFELYRNFFLKEKMPHLKWVGYLSATSVYGDLQGKECDEHTPTIPKSQRGNDRLTCEKLWMSLYYDLNIPIHIFRLAGIYGPERNNLQEIKSEKFVSIVKPDHLSNRIYVKDLVRALFLSMKNPTAGEIFNLSDDCPASSAMVNDYCAFLLDVAEPIKKYYDDIEESLSDIRKSFFLESKIIKNQKIKDILGFNLVYPTYREGIWDILQTGSFLCNVSDIKH